MAGIDVSKALLYAVLAPPVGIAATKANLYAVLGPPAGIAATKANLYAVLDIPVAPSWGSFSFGGGVVSSAYSQSFSANGSAPITYAVQTGSLPGGLTLSSNTISGTPTTAGTFNFSIRATNDYGTADKDLTIVVVNPTLPDPVAAYAWSY